MKYTIIIFAFLLTLNSFAQEEKDESQITTCQLVKKEFINKGGNTSGFSEYYLRCSIQDYFIKFCESDIKSEDLDPYLDQGITVRMTIKEGSWDICTGYPDQMQSRIGAYISIQEIINDENED